MIFPRSLPTLLLAAGLHTAPFQCARPPRTAEREREESPGEALSLLADRFGAQGNEAARTATLRFLVERYPTSRFAMRAREALADAGTQ